MRILFVTQALPYLPARDGFRLYAANLIRFLSRRHQIDVISLSQDDDEEHLSWCQERSASLNLLSNNWASSLLKPLHIFSTYAWGRPLLLRRRVADLIFEGMRTSPWDVLHVEGGYVAGLIPDGLPIPKILSVHDSGVVRCDQMARFSGKYRERFYYRALAQIEPTYERQVYPRFDRCVVVSEADARAVCSTVPGCNVAVVPNGIDTEYFSPIPIEKRGKILVFHGNLGYAPNVEAATEFIRNIFPLIQAHSPSCIFHLIGARPVQALVAIARLPNIWLSADLPDLRGALCSGEIYVCPIRHGSGVKNKLLEAMAMGLAIVCYPEASAGIECTHGMQLLIAADKHEFAAHVLRLLREPQVAEQMGKTARAWVQANYDWDSRARMFEEIYAAVTKDPMRKTKSGPLSTINASLRTL